MCRRKSLVKEDNGPYTYYWVDLTVVDGVPDKMFGTVSLFRSFCQMSNGMHKNGAVEESEFMATWLALSNLRSLLANADGELISNENRCANVDFSKSQHLLDVFRDREHYLSARLIELAGDYRETCTEE